MVSSRIGARCGRGLALVVWLTWALIWATPQPAAAIADGRPAPDSVARGVVTIMGSPGNVCTGVLIAANIVMTAAHCITPGGTYRVIDPTTTPPRLLTTRTVATHPQYSGRSLSAHQATADIALLLLPAAVPAKAAMPLATSRPLAAGARLTIVGIGVTASNADDVGVARIASLVVTGQPTATQLRLVDPRTNNRRDGQGACTGDSGAPVFDDQHGQPVVVGIVSWSTGAADGAGCGGLTGVTPLVRYRDWIIETARALGSALTP